MTNGAGRVNKRVFHLFSPCFCPNYCQLLLVVCSAFVEGTEREADDGSPGKRSAAAANPITGGASTADRWYGARLDNAFPRKEGVFNQTDRPTASDDDFVGDCLAVKRVAWLVWHLPDHLGPFYKYWPFLLGSRWNGRPKEKTHWSTCDGRSEMASKGGWRTEEGFVMPNHNPIDRWRSDPKVYAGRSDADDVAAMAELRVKRERERERTNCRGQYIKPGRGAGKLTACCWISSRRSKPIDHGGLDHVAYRTLNHALCVTVFYRFSVLERKPSILKHSAPPMRQKTTT